MKVKVYQVSPPGDSTYKYIALLSVLVEELPRSGDHISIDIENHLFSFVVKYVVWKYNDILREVEIIVE